jgi:(1->4)-alpha-D-glucan 1-alpha-D-glucosylmutase
MGMHTAKRVSGRRAIERVCRLHGIEPRYSDAWGKRHTVSTRSLEALLAALGVRAGNPQEAAASIRAAELDRWRAVLAPAAVIREGDVPWKIRLNLRGESANALAWRLVQEDGASYEVAFDPASLKVLESAELDGERYIARQLLLGLALPCGYHRLSLLGDGMVLGEAQFIVVPVRCYRQPGARSNRRTWGAATQLYALRSAHNWGIGDFTDLSALLVQWDARGAGIVGVNPLHALFPHDAERASPYSPSSRRFFNVLYLDIEAVPDFNECDDALAEVRSRDFQSRLKAVRDAELVDYAGVAELKFAMLERCYAHFRDRHLTRNTGRAQAFRAYQAAHAPALRSHALFEALQERFHREDPRVGGWSAWPDAYRNRTSPEVERFAEAHGARVEFFEYLQWQAELQLQAVGNRSTKQGLAAGLYADLAVSIDRDGAEAWANQDLYAVTASVGAPPDIFNVCGQDWGLPPVVPGRLRAAAYAPFIDMLRANMRHANALRIDHVMALARLFWVPKGAKPGDGAYVCYPFDDLVGIVALESHRNRCVVIGEDLGTVEPKFRKKLARVGILSCKVLYFEHGKSGDFKAPRDYIADALVTATTHDLPTLAGYWEGHDLVLRQQLGLFPSEEARQAQVLARAQDRARLLPALEREGLLPAGATVDPASLPEMTFAFMQNIYAFLARTRARVLMIQPEDVLGMREQVNLPGTVREYPNWRRKLPLALERWPDDERFLSIGRLLAGLRPLVQPAPARKRPGAARIPRARSARG